MFESEEAYWLVQFTTYSEDYDGLVNDFKAWVRTVTFEE